MQSNHTYGDIIVRKNVLENIVSQDISIFNNNTGEVNVNYQWKVSPWIILRMITLLEKLTHNLNFVHTLSNKRISMHRAHMLI